MNTSRPIPPHVIEPQRRASDPTVSAWVTANAGSGKTHVLAERVIRLLLAGTDPAKILCITFTKAAAANMAMRVFNTLAAWTAYDDATLDDAIAKLNGRANAALRTRARRLFALALETPGGLKVQTIHAFCTRLLHQFPFEADVAARFSVLDEASEHELLEDISLSVLLKAAAEPDSVFGRALSTAVVSAADQTFREVIREAIGARDKLAALLAHFGSIDGIIDDLSRRLNLDPAETAEGIAAQFFSGPYLSTTEWSTLIDALAEGSDEDRKQITRLNAAQSAASLDERVEHYLAIFLTGAGERRKRLVTKPVANNAPEWLERLAAEQDRVFSLVEKRKALACRDRTRALLTIAEAVIARYRVEKDRRGVLDYEDLIDKTLQLFDKASAAWVLYKLDLGIDHVLIDEAQDTSPKQWQIVRTLVNEFTAGRGAREVLRTLFVVGDDKQSIFSFQGAVPRYFDEIRRAFNQSFKQAEREFHEVRLEASFRSSEIILNAVDTVFAQERAFVGLVVDRTPTVHQALPDAAPGLVEVWPLIKADKQEKSEAWDTPFDAVSQTSPQVQLAKKIARYVATTIGSAAVGRGDERGPARAGDILILVRQRGALFEAIIRALKTAQIPVAGADRLVLTDHIAVMDLLVLADCLLLPEDDLALATALKSPLFGFDDNDLFDIAWNRGSLSLRQSLANKGKDNPRFAEAASQLDAWAAAARSDSPFTFYARLLGACGGRKRMLARLGPEASDPLDEFLNLALTYETRETPSLQGFVAWLRAAEAEIKRDMELSRDEVRVMTVHGAKGLEAPIVILADTTTAPAGPSQHQARVLTLAASDAPPHLVWAGKKDDDVPAVAAARQAARDDAANEYRRLLYVAMTRAAERLIVCGTEGVHKRPDDCWYDLVYDALAPLAVEIPGTDGEEPTLRFEKPGAIVDHVRAAPAKGGATVSLPDWLTQRSPAEAQPPVVITPSEADDEPHATPAVGDRAAALLRGRALHRLMQSLPDLPSAQREAAARSYLARAAAGLDKEEHETIATQVLRLLADSRFAPLFAPGSRAEVPIVGRHERAGEPVMVSGQVDRLAVTAAEVLIADYKTNRPAPRSLAEVPKPYIRQLALYRALLGRIYPDRRVRAALVWTELPDLMEIPAAILDAAI
jgi:ATP-dependent helicase/nuclease subunit A